MEISKIKESGIKKCFRLKSNFNPNILCLYLPVVVWNGNSLYFVRNFLYCDFLKFNLTAEWLKSVLKMEKLNKNKKKQYV